MTTYAFKVTIKLASSDSFVVKDAPLSDIFEAKTIVDQILTQFKEYIVRTELQITFDEYEGGDEVEEVMSLAELEERLLNIIIAYKRYEQELDAQLSNLSNKLEDALGSHYFNSTDRSLHVTMLTHSNRYYYFTIGIDETRQFNVHLENPFDEKSCIVCQTDDEVIEELHKVENIFVTMQNLAESSKFNIF